MRPSPGTDSPTGTDSAAKSVSPIRPVSVVAASPAARRSWRAVGLVAATVGAVVLSGCSAGQKAQTSEEISVVDGGRGSVGDIHLNAVSVGAAPIAGWSKGDSAPLQLAIANSGSVADSLVKVTSPMSPNVTFAANANALTQTCAPSPSGSGTALAPSDSTSTGQATVSASVSAASTPGSVSTSASASTAVTATTATTGTAATTGPVAPSTESTAPSPACTAAPGPDSFDIGAGQSVSIGFAATDKQLILTKLTGDVFPGQAFPITFTFAQAGSVTVNVSVHLNTSASNSPSIVPSLTGE